MEDAAKKTYGTHVSMKSWSVCFFRRKTFRCPRCPTQKGEERSGHAADQLAWKGGFPGFSAAIFNLHFQLREQVVQAVKTCPGRIAEALHRKLLSDMFTDKHSLKWRCSTQQETNTTVGTKWSQTVIKCHTLRHTQQVRE